MPLKLMYITNSPSVAQTIVAAGVDRIFVDMEVLGKADRQGGMDTVQSAHTLNDIRVIRSAVPQTELLVRCNPVHDANGTFVSTEQEIDGIIDAGADIIMLPYFKTVTEVQRFLNAVNGRVRTMLLFETPQSVLIAEEVVALTGIDEVFIGLNDLSLGYGKRFMFSMLADGTVEHLCNVFRAVGLPFGFGGVAAVGKGMLPAERIIAEHYRLGSTCVILSRSFCNVDKVADLSVIRKIFCEGLADIRDFELLCRDGKVPFEQNRIALVDAVKMIEERAV